MRACVDAVSCDFNIILNMINQVEIDQKVVIIYKLTQVLISKEEEINRLKQKCKKQKSRLLKTFRVSKAL